MPATRKALQWILLALACFASMPALAVQPDEILGDPKLEARARELSRELRCMVCQNQSIDDSDAPLARDLRILVRERLSAGDSDTQVLDFLSQRYGSFVLLKPRFTWETALLWLAPLGALAAGACGLVIALRRRRGQTVPDSEQGGGLSPAEQSRLAEIVGQSDK